MADVNAKIAELNAIIGNDFDPDTYEALNGSKETFIGLLKFKREIEQNGEVIIPANAPKAGYKWATEGSTFRTYTGDILSKNEIALALAGKKEGVSSPYLLSLIGKKKNADDKDSLSGIQELFKYLEDNNLIEKA